MKFLKVWNSDDPSMLHIALGTIFVIAAMERVRAYSKARLENGGFLGAEFVTHAKAEDVTDMPHFKSEMVV